MTIEDFQNLSHGDAVTKIAYGKAQSFRYVGRMPSSDQYFIFSCGEDLCKFHTNENPNMWHIGTYDSKYVGEQLIAYHENQIKIIKEIYI